MPEGGGRAAIPRTEAEQVRAVDARLVEWWGRYARQKANIVDPRKVFHSFRHTFKDAYRACHIPEEVHDALTGHSGGGVGRSYVGLHYPLVPLVEAMKKLRYPGLPPGAFEGAQPRAVIPTGARGGQITASLTSID